MCDPRLALAVDAICVCSSHISEQFRTYLKSGSRKGHASLVYRDLRRKGPDGKLTKVFVTKASMLAEFFFALAMLWWEGLRALKIDISS